MLKINFDERIEKLNTLLNIWSQRNLTIKGRITILKAKALPLVTYVSKKNDKPVDFYHFQVKLKTRMVIEEYRSELYNRKLDFLVKWSVLSDSL